MGRGEFDNYFKYDVWTPKPKTGPAPPAAKTGDAALPPEGRLFLPARMGEVKLSSKGWGEEVFAVCEPIYADGITSTSHGDRRFAPGMAVPADDEWEGELPAPPAGDDPASQEASVEAALPLVGELLATLEARDGPAFERVREQLNAFARSISVSQVVNLEELISARLGPTWAEFVAEDPDGAELFRQAHIGQALVIETPKQETCKAEFADKTLLYFGVLSVGLHLGPRFRTRQITMTNMKWRPTGLTGWQF